MSERERWIVYPLIFFALGAAVRDKLLQRVEAKEIVCESVAIVDLQNPTQILAELGFRRIGSDDAPQFVTKVGQLRLVDSEGNDLFEVDAAAILTQLGGHLLRAIEAQADDPPPGDEAAPTPPGKTR